jgi:nucleotide-binding universal stress UspA family protein
MYRSIVLPLDGSSFAEEAVPLAGHLARTFDSDLHLVHVIRPIPDMDFKTPEQDLELKARLREAASDALGEIASELRRDGVRARADVREGKVVDALLEALGEGDAELVVLTSHGAGGFRRWWLGSVADALIRRSHRPVLLVRPWDETEDRPTEDGPRFPTILVPLDGSEESESVLPHARALQESVGSRLILMRVVPSPLEVGSLYGVPSVRLEGESHREHKAAATAYLEEVAARDLFPAPGEPGAPERRVLEATGAAEGVLEGARVTGADLIALASSGRGGFGRTVIGSVADKVIRGAAPPVLVVPPPA